MKYLLCIIFSGVLFSCSKENDSKDFVGLWKSNDGAIIILKKDKSFIIENVNLNNIVDFESNFNKIINLTGEWELDKNNQSINLNSNFTFDDFGISNNYIEYGKKKSHTISTSFKINSKKLSLFGKKECILFRWIGDPDDLLKYEFIKIK